MYCRAVSFIRILSRLRSFPFKSHTYRNSTSTTNFTGWKTEYTHDLNVYRPESADPIPVYRILNPDGHLVKPGIEPSLQKDDVLKMYKVMVLLNTLDRIMYDAQRQGRISFYMTNYGEESSHVGSVAALHPNDFIYGQYREAGVLMWRGFTLEQMIDQCYSNCDDVNKGRQMPVHYGSKQHNFSTISSPLATQIPIAVGTSYSFKLAQNDQVVVCYFGEGAASEGDAFTGMNFAATLDCPIIFICRNNGYAISTPVHEQYRGDGITARAHALGMIGFRVDGNDILGVYKATQLARKISLSESRPVLIEAMTYRVGHHSTSDDSSAYRSVDEVTHWDVQDNPIIRLRRYLFHKKWLTDEEEKQLRKDSRKQVLDVFAKSESKKRPNPLLLFTDVYSSMPRRLKQQMHMTKEHIERHANEYPLSAYNPMEDLPDKSQR